MSNTTNDNFDFDFSSNAGGQVSTLESFLDDAPTEIKEDVTVPKEPIINLESKGDIGEETPTSVDSEDSTREDIDLTKNESKPNVDAVDIDLNIGDEGEATSGTSDKDTTGIDYKRVIQRLIDEKVWDGIDAFETEEGEVSFEDMEIDEETFFAIYSQKNKETQEKLLEDKVSISKTSEFTKKLIEIEANGGDVQQALQSYNQYKSPLEGLDLTKESDQQAALYLKYQAKGLEDGDILQLISTYKSNGDLETKANEAKVDLETAFNRQMEALNEEAIVKKQRRKEELKNYRNALGDNLKTFELSDSYRKKLLEIASKEDDKGQFQLDTLYYNLRQDPKKAAELVLFLSNKEEYIKQVTSAQVRENKLDTMRRIKLVPKGKSSLKIKENSRKTSNKNLIDLSTFKTN